MIAHFLQSDIYGKLLSVKVVATLVCLLLVSAQYILTFHNS